MELAGGSPRPCHNLENFGPARDHQFDQTIDYWGGRAHDDKWREPALARIEKTRKAVWKEQREEAKAARELEAEVEAETTE